MTEDMVTEKGTLPSFGSLHVLLHADYPNDFIVFKGSDIYLVARDGEHEIRRHTMPIMHAMWASEEDRLRVMAYWLTQEIIARGSHREEAAP